MKKYLIMVILVYSIFVVSGAADQKLVPAPGFSLVDVSDKMINLSDFKGKNVLLFQNDQIWLFLQPRYILYQSE